MWPQHIMRSRTREQFREQTTWRLCRNGESAPAQLYRLLKAAALFPVAEQHPLPVQGRAAGACLSCPSVMHADIGFAVIECRSSLISPVKNPASEVLTWRAATTR